MRKKFAVLATAVVLSLTFASTALANWEQEGERWRYNNEDGSYARDQIMNIGGVNYAFGQDAYMQTGWQRHQNNWYYFDPASGAQVTGWIQLNGIWYYLNPNTGIMQTGWVDVGDNRYYMDESGAMKTGIIEVDEYRYFAQADGSIKRNAVDVEESTGNVIRYDEMGRMTYKNDENEAFKKGGGGDAYQNMLSGENLDRQRQEIQQANEDFRQEKKDELYEEYMQKIPTERSPKNRQTKLQNWENKVNRELSALDASQEEINTYISSVKLGRYGRDDDRYNDEDDEYSYYD